MTLLAELFLTLCLYIVFSYIVVLVTCKLAKFARYSSFASYASLFFIVVSFVVILFGSPMLASAIV